MYSVPGESRAASLRRTSFGRRARGRRVSCAIRLFPGQKDPAPPIWVMKSDHDLGPSLPSPQGYPNGVRPQWKGWGWRCEGSGDVAEIAASPVRSGAITRINPIDSQLMGSGSMHCCRGHHHRLGLIEGYPGSLVDDPSANFCASALGAGDARHRLARAGGQ